jgi:release factor glutamine methyltransferase
MTQPSDDLVDRLRAAGCINPEAELALIRRWLPTPRDQSLAVEQRANGMPLELVVGVAEFAGIAVQVRRGVFLPRRRSESLLEAAELFVGVLETEVPDRKKPVALDLGCGSGAIAAAFVTRNPRWQVEACDVDPTAVECAELNAARFGFAVHRTEWFSGLPSRLHGRIDLVLAHLPYVPTGQLPQLARDYRAVEPLQAVDGGPDGLVPWRQVLRTSERWMSPAGRILTQVAEHQSADAVIAARRAGLEVQVLTFDDALVIAAHRAAHQSSSSARALSSPKGPRSIRSSSRNR